MVDQNHSHGITYLKNYTAPTYLIEKVDLIFELGEEGTQVTSRLQISRDSFAEETAPLILNGEDLELISLHLNDKALTKQDYQLSTGTLTIPHVPASFILESVVKIKPQENTMLSGLYRSNNIFCTQCEAEGFRRITYFIDRPDVLAYYTTTIIADKTLYPILLSNGNNIEEKLLADNKHLIKWQDPFKKPSYLFALIAGNLDFIEDKFITKSGLPVVLRIFVEKNQQEKAYYAMECLKKIMAWDEKAYGREYDLEIFMIVAISDFNMGAMENKGLNIFNAKYILVEPETATDNDYQGVLIVVGHEYLHNWSGNRVTCRDWFQLSLKEGLTVFREHEFTSDMNSPLVERINTVRALRNTQFREDAGPLAHPVQPDSYIEINNFYTTTIYEKGAEVIHMLKVLLGAAIFRKGMDLYFSHNDGLAVTIEEFISAMEEASGRDLKQFRLWYHQAGTPEVTLNSNYDANQKTYTLTVKQACPPTPNQPLKKPFHIPLALGLLDSKGKNIPLQLVGETKPGSDSTRILELTKEQEEFKFINVLEPPIPSVLRGFSAPVKLNIAQKKEELLFLSQHDTDGFGRWEAGQKIAATVLLSLVESYQNKTTMQVAENFISIFQNLLTSEFGDKAFLTELLTLPSETYLGESMAVIDVDAIHAARKYVRQELATKLKTEFLVKYRENIDNETFSLDSQAMAKRRLKNSCLHYLMVLNEADIRDLCFKQFTTAKNMTDQMSALAAFANIECPERAEVLKSFYSQWKNEPLVIDKWFAIQAQAELPHTLQNVKTLLQHPAFQIKNPNKVRALLGTFCHNNPVQFHAKDGAGYTFITDQALIIDKLNPIVAARLVSAMTYWRRYDENRQQLMRAQLERVANAKGISKDVYEVATKSLK